MRLPSRSLGFGFEIGDQCRAARRIGHFDDHARAGHLLGRRGEIFVERFFIPANFRGLERRAVIEPGDRARRPAHQAVQIGAHHAFAARFERMAGLARGERLRTGTCRAGIGRGKRRKHKCSKYDTRERQGEQKFHYPLPSGNSRCDDVTV